MAVIPQVERKQPKSEHSPLIGEKHELFREAGLVFRIGFPNVLQSLTGYLMNVSSMIILGHLAGPRELAGASMGSVVGGILGLTVLMGLSEAIDTLCSQAFGARHYKDMGQIMQRGLTLLMIFASLISIVFWNSESLLLISGQHPSLSKSAANYIRGMIPGIFGYSTSIAFQRFLSAQGQTRPLWYVATATVPIHVGMTYFLVGPLGLGERGAATAWSTVHLLRGLVLVIFTIHYEIRKPDEARTWQTFQWKTLSEEIWRWGRILRVSLPAMAMLAAEFWAFEILVLFAGMLPNPETQVIAVSICLNVTGLAFMFPAGTSIAVCVRIGKHLGAGDILGAKNTIFAAAGVCTIQWLIIASILLLPFVRDNLSELFSPPSTTPIHESKDIASIVSECVVYVVCQQFFDSQKELLNGALRGGGRQTVGLILSILAYFGVCIPLAYALAFGTFNQTWPVRVPGLFVATIAASVVHASLNVWAVLGTDWNNLVHMVSKSMRQQSEDGSDIDLSLQEPTVKPYRSFSDRSYA
ncbi:hypothetical protein AAMO2058_000009500 [Amorphochlora amoebiformis]